MRRILVVDDDEAILTLISHMLGDEFEIITALSAVDAMKKIYSTPFDMIISDVNMPKMDGFTFAKNVKREENFKEMPFIFLTLRKSKNDVSRAIGLGASEYIVKPFKKAYLLDKVEKVLSKSKFERKADRKAGVDSEVLERDIKCSGQVVIIKEISIETITATDISIKTEIDLEDGDIIQLRSELLQQYGIPTIRVKVLETVEIDGPTYTILVGHVDTTPEYKQTIRDIIENNPPKKAA